MNNKTIKLYRLYFKPTQSVKLVLTFIHFFILISCLVQKWWKKQPLCNGSLLLLQSFIINPIGGLKICSKKVLTYSSSEQEQV